MNTLPPVCCMLKMLELLKASVVIKFKQGAATKNVVI